MTKEVPIGVAPNGARRTQRDHAALPITPDELADTAAACAAAGASWLHVHVRDEHGGHTLDAGRYRDAFDAIRARVGDALLLQMTTEAVGLYSPAQQIAAVRTLRPEAVSIAVRELFADAALEADALRLVHELRERDVAVQFICYDTADIERLVALHRPPVPSPSKQPAGFQGCPEILLVLGSYAMRRAGHPRELLPLLAAMPPAWRWSACAFGAGERLCLAAAAALGGGVRVGFENNVALPDGSVAPDNATQVARLAQALAAMGLTPASAEQTRRRFQSLKEIE
jgi:3-keto-5-aminohexanoate cleavage enzyme